MRPQRFLSRETGQPALTADGIEIGRVVDMTVKLHVSHPMIHRVAIGSGRRIRYLVPWSLVRDLDELELHLADDRAAMPRYLVGRDPQLDESELLICRDVLDTQVVDLAGQRLSRVSDVLVVHRSDGEVEIAAVDVGLGSLLRRMGLVRLGASIAPVAVDWDDLHLTSSRGHLVQLSTSTTGMHRLDALGLAELLARLSTDKATDVIRKVGPARSAGALHASHPVLRHRLLHALDPKAAQQVIDAAPPATAKDLAELRHTAAPPRRRFLRTAGWRAHRPPPPTRPDAGGDR